MDTIIIELELYINTIQMVALGPSMLIDGQLL